MKLLIRLSLILILFFFLNFNLTFGQRYDYVWVFGDSAGISFNDLANPISFTSVLKNEYGENYSSIADKNGVLQFYMGYCDGPGGTSGYFSAIYNSSFQVMPGGDSIPSDRSCTQGTLILPSLTDSNQYYLFYLCLGPTILTGFPIGFYYSVIDMSLNGGSGEVILKNIPVSIPAVPSYFTEKLTAVKHGNGRDWWIMIHDYGTDQFNKFLFTPYGIITMPSQSIGTIYTNGNGSQGQMIFSKNGNRLACAGAGTQGVLDVFNFDRCTGMLSNWINLNDSTTKFYGCSFSPDNSLLYASTYSTRKLFQFNLAASNILASKTLLFTGHPNYWIGGHQLAPDDKIYITSYYYMAPNNFFSTYNMNLTVINNPEVYGSGCNVTPYSFYLGGKRTLGSLPNMVSYDLGADAGSPCDTILAVNEIISNQHQITISPNPAKNIFYINYNSKENQTAEFILYNSFSQKVKSKNLFNNTKAQSINTTGLPNGIYIWQVKTKDKNISSGKLVILK